MALAMAMAMAMAIATALPRFILVRDVFAKVEVEVEVGAFLEGSDAVTQLTIKKLARAAWWGSEYQPQYNIYRSIHFGGVVGHNPMLHMQKSSSNIKGLWLNIPHIVL